jgi:hypothetical protein
VAARAAVSLIYSLYSRRLSLASLSSVLVILVIFSIFSSKALILAFALLELYLAVSNRLLYYFFISLMVRLSFLILSSLLLVSIGISGSSSKRGILPDGVAYWLHIVAEGRLGVIRAIALVLLRVIRYNTK